MSTNTLVNKLMGLTDDLIGGSSLMWRYHHQVSTHTFDWHAMTSVVGCVNILSTAGVVTPARALLHQHQQAVPKGKQQQQSWWLGAVHVANVLILVIHVLF